MNIRIVEKQQDYCSGGYARVVERSEKFDSIKYKDLRSEKHTYKSKIGSNRIENPYTQFRQIFRCAQQLVQISRHISLVATYPSARAQNCKETAKLMFCRICNPTA